MGTPAPQAVAPADRRWSECVRRAWTRRHVRAAAPALCLLLVLLFAGRLLHTAHQKSFTFDEPAYVGTGIYLWQSGDYHFARSLGYHPPLTFHLASLPLLALDLEGVEVSSSLGGRLMRGAGPDPHRVRLLSRLPFIALACWGAVLVFLWAREVAGAAAGLLAAFLYTFSPAILANGNLAHSDITVSVLYLQTVYAFWRWWSRPTPGRFLACGVSLGLAVIAKASAVLLFPALGLLLLGIALRLPWLVPADRRLGPEGVGRRLGWSILLGVSMVGIVVVVIWLGYGGSFALTTGIEGSAWEDVALPGYLQALVFDIEANALPRPVYFFGEHVRGGLWYFLPVAFALKTPLAVLGLLGLALATRRPDARGLALILGIPTLVFLGVALFWLKVPLGVRYILPLLPLMHVFIATRLIPLESSARRAVTVVACVWLAVASLWIHPHYLAYFNEASGGPRHGHRYLVDSNLDWGQDLPALAAELNSRYRDETVWLAYFGADRPSNYGIAARVLEGCEPVTGPVAISSSVLRRLYSPTNLFARPPEGCYDWLLEYEPIAQPGYSILLYEVPQP